MMIPGALIALTLMQAPAAAATTLPPSTVALVETYADGRVNYELTRRQAGEGSRARWLK